MSVVEQLNSPILQAPKEHDSLTQRDRPELLQPHVLDNEDRTALHLEPSINELPKSPEQSALRSFIRNKMPPWAYGISSVLHLATTAILYFGKFSDDTRKTLAASATRFTKFVNSLVYSDLAVDALKNNFSFDFLGRIAEPVMNMFVDLNHYHLFRGFSSALNQLHTINLPRVKEGLNLKENFLANIDASIEFFKESWVNGGMARLFKGDFSQWKNDFFGGKNDHGHTLAVASHGQMLISGLALLNGNKRNLLNRVLGVARNAIGVLADIGLLFEKDSSARWVGTFYLLHAVGDTIKRFVPAATQDIIDNLIMPFYNGGLYCFGLMTRRQVDGTYLFNDNVKKAELGVQAA